MTTAAFDDKSNPTQTATRALFRTIVVADLTLIFLFPVFLRILFAARIVLVVHLLCALPFALWLGTSMRTRFNRGRTSPLPIMLIAVTIWIASILIPVVRCDTNSMPASRTLLESFFIRSCLVIGLVLPVGVGALSGRNSGQDQLKLSNRSGYASLAWFAVTLTIAAGLPAMFTLDFMDRRYQLATDLLTRQQLLPAQRLTEQLCILGSQRAFDGTLPTVMLTRLSSVIQNCNERLVYMDSNSAELEQIIERARLLAVLDRTDEACACLEPIAGIQPEAAMLLGSILQSEGHSAESTRWYRVGLGLLGDQHSKSETMSVRVRAYDAIAFNHRALRNAPAAEAVYRDAIHAMPQAKPYFHFQLGRHHELGGRPLAAIGELQTAAALAPQLYQQRAEAVIRRILERSPSCGITIVSPVGSSQ